MPNACYTAAAGTGFDAVKDDAANFGPTNPRRFTHHYMLWTHQQVAGGTASGCAELPGNDIQVALGAWNYFCSGGANNGGFCLSNANCPGAGGSCQPSGDQDGDGTADQDVGTIQQQAGTLMHELGHNLNLGHGGGDWTNNKPNYLSVMNYTFQTSGLPPTDPDAGGPLTGRVDYSRAALAHARPRPTLAEPAGIGDGADNTFFACPGATAAARRRRRHRRHRLELRHRRARQRGLSQRPQPRPPPSACVEAPAPTARATPRRPATTSSRAAASRKGPNRQCDTRCHGRRSCSAAPLGPLTRLLRLGQRQVRLPERDRLRGRATHRRVGARAGTDLRGVRDGARARRDHRDERHAGHGGDGRHGQLRDHCRQRAPGRGAQRRRHGRVAGDDHLRLVRRRGRRRVRRQRQRAHGDVRRNPGWRNPPPSRSSPR